jgi:ABC-type glycerol-3-phosphate transport system substrate-binding protein
MKRIWLSLVAMFVMLAVIFGCGQEEKQESKVKKAVEEVVTREFKIYEDAKRSLEEIEKKSQERRDIEKEVR